MLTFSDIISSHLTRREARESASRSERVVLAGRFGSGSFGLYVRERVNSDGCIIPIDGHKNITVWHVVSKKREAK